jgi:hypothetical protein
LSLAFCSAATAKITASAGFVEMAKLRASLARRSGKMQMVIAKERNRKKEELFTDSIS